MEHTQDNLTHDSENSVDEVTLDSQTETTETVAKSEPSAKPEKRSKSKSAQRIKELEEQNAQLNDKVLRSMAEFENFRKRTTKEKEDLFAFASAASVSALLPVFDNLELALSAPCSDEEFKKGCEMILSQLATAMEKLGVSEIKALGEQFNPEIHNAVMHDSDDSVEENTITQVLQKGYIMGERVIRHAMVKVAN